MYEDLKENEQIICVRYSAVEDNEKKKTRNTFIVFKSFQELEDKREELRKKHKCDQIDISWRVISSDDINFNTYQEQAFTTAEYPNVGNNIEYAALGLGEAGEVQNAVKKIQRDDKNNVTDDRRDEIIKELGDVLWYVAACASELRIPLSEIAKTNLKKLKERYK